MRWRWPAGLIAVGLAAAAPALGQGSELPPCSSAVPPPTIAIVETGSSVLYATHTLHLKPSPQGDDVPSVQSVSAPGAHVGEDGNEQPTVLVNDKPGPFSVSAVLLARESDGSSCTTSAATTVQLASAARSKASKLKRPHYVVPRRKLYKPNPTFSFTVKPNKAAPDRTPFTVRVRVSRRFRLPGKGAKARMQVFPRRTARGFPKGVEVDVRPHSDHQLATKGLKVIATSPSGYPADRALKFFQTPWGLDLQVLQSGRQIARLKVVARCSGGGQSSRCRFKKVLLAR